MINERKPATLTFSPVKQMAAPALQETGAPKTDTQHIPLDLIDESDRMRLRTRPYPGIEELAIDISAATQLMPMFVRPKAERYELISGYRRLAALKMLKAPTAYCRIFREISDNDAYDLAVRENQKRKNMTDLERADICLRYQTQGMTIEQIAKRMDWKGDRAVYHHLRVAKEASEQLRAALQARKLSFKVAVVLVETKTAQLGDPTEREILQTIMENGMSARQARAHVARVAKAISTTGPSELASAPETKPHSIKEYKNGAFMITAKIDPSDPAEVPEAIAIIEVALKRARQLQKKLRATS